MRIMRIRRLISCCAVLVFGAATLTGLSAANAAASAGASARASTGAAPGMTGTSPSLTSYYAYTTGYGATLAAAEADAQAYFAGLGVCGPGHLVRSGQEADGTWWAYEKAFCNADG
jgi:hypothetical protein